MAFYRCGGANHYDEGYTAGYSAGYNNGKTDKRTSGYTDKTVVYEDSSGDEWSKTLTIPNLSRIDTIVSAYFEDLYGGRHGFVSLYIAGTNTVHYDVSGAFSTGWKVTITGRQYHAND